MFSHVIRVVIAYMFCAAFLQGCYSDSRRSRISVSSHLESTAVFPVNGNVYPSGYALLLHDSFAFVILLVFLLMPICGSPLRHQGNVVVFPVNANVYPSGYFYTTLKLGEPAKPYDFDIDTGSDLTWVNCDAPCVNCPKSPHQPYKPRNNALTCGESLCGFLQRPLNDPCLNPSDQCDYEIEYADHGSSYGVVVKDRFFLEFLNGSTGSPPIAFGCGYDQDLSASTNPPFVDGVLGLASKKFSILSQLYDLKMVRNVFGHCFSSKGGGYLFFGDKIVPSETIWVAMSKIRIGNYYSIGPAELLFNGKNVLKTGLSFVLDSGSTYTYLNRQVYEATISMIKKNIDGKGLKMAPEDKTLPLCWKGSKPYKSIADVQKFFQPLSLRFSKAKNAIMEMPPETYLIISKNGNVCLGILDGSEAELGNLNVLGDVSMLNKMVIYDNEKNQIGWTTTNCNSLPKLDFSVWKGHYNEL